MKLACVVQRFGPEVTGGSERHCQVIAEQLALRHDVTILTSCAQDYVTWRNVYPAGASRVGRLSVLRFPAVAERHLGRLAEQHRVHVVEMGRLPPDVRGELEATSTYDPVLGTTTSSTHIAVLEIDPDTYLVRLERFVVAEDCGTIINPLIVDGQVHGGVAQGIGAALYEEVVYDEQGQILTASLVDYVVPAASEIPPMHVVHMETASPAIGGFRGMGEGGTIGAPAAVANAISDALAPLGIEISELPVTPERLFRLIEAAKSRTGDHG